jgi:hypothetical protein
LRHPADRRCRKLIGAECGEHVGIEAGIPLKAPVDIVANAIMAADLIQQLVDDARTESVDAADELLPALD